MASPAESTAAARRNESATEVWVHDEGVYRVDHFADHSRPVSFSATLGRVSFSDFLTADQADQLADALKAHAALVREREAQAS
jgi:neutral trehalase